MRYINLLCIWAVIILPNDQVYNSLVHYCNYIIYILNIFNQVLHNSLHACHHLKYATLAKGASVSDAGFLATAWLIAGNLNVHVFIHYIGYTYI